MKRQICMVVMFLAGAIAAFALPEFGLSAGIGGITGGHFTRYRMRAGEPEARLYADQNINLFETGVFAFFDATFATVSVFFQSGAGNFGEPISIGGYPLPEMSRSGQGWQNVLGFSLLGRYPFRLNDRLTVFPLLGMDYTITLIYRRTDAYGFVYNRDDGIREDDRGGLGEGNAFSLSDWNAFLITLGGGVEFDLTENIFLRGDLLYRIRLMTNYERRNLELMKGVSGDDTLRFGNGLSGLSSGPSFRLSAGWRF